MEWLKTKEPLLVLPSPLVHFQIIFKKIPFLFEFSFSFQIEEITYRVARLVTKHIRTLEEFMHYEWLLGGMVCKEKFVPHF